MLTISSKDFEVFVKHVDHVFDSEDCTESLVFSEEAQSDKAIPLSKIDSGRRVLWFDSDHTAFDFGRWFEAVSRDFD